MIKLNQEKKAHNIQSSYTPLLFERSEFLIDTSQKKSLRVCTCARVHVCNNLGFSVWYYVPHTYVPGISSLSAGYQDTYQVYVDTYVPGWGTYYVPHMFVNWCEHVCLFERSEFLIRAKRVSNWYIQKKSLRVCPCARVHGCSTNLGFSVGSANRLRPKHVIPLPA